MQNIKSRKKTKYGKEGVAGVVFAMIPITGFLIFGLIPMITAVIMSFLKIQGYNFEGATFVGFGNYKLVVNDDRFGNSIRNTLLASIGMPISLVLSLTIASLLNRNAVGTKVFRTILFIPYVCSVVAITTMWKWMYDYNFGIINSVLGSFGIKQIGWIIDKKYFMLSMILMGIWSGTGFGIILYSAALGNVPKTYYEAAKIDGAKGLTAFFRITLPLITPTTFFLLTMGLIGALQDFARFQIMGGVDGGPNEAGLTVVFWLYRMGFTNVITEGMGKASATSLLLAIVIILITRLNFWLSKKWVHYD